MMAPISMRLHASGTSKTSSMPNELSYPPLPLSILSITTPSNQLGQWDNTSIIGMGYFAGPRYHPLPGKRQVLHDKERDDWATKNPVGTGPFQFVRWQRDVKQVYKKFDGYWQKGKPYLDGIEWNLIKDPVVLEASFRAKEQDILYLLTPIIARGLKTSGFNITELKTGLGLLMLGIMPNSAMPDSPFANLKARQAINYAIDTKAILDSQYFGFGVATQQWGVPNGYWANPNFKDYPLTGEGKTTGG